MQYKCSRCHERFATEGETEAIACPRCHAEAGLEVQHGPAGAMRLFGLLLALVLVAAVVGGLLSRLAG